MILLPTENPTLLEICKAYLSGDPIQKAIVINDFDQTLFKVEQNAENPDILTVSTNMKVASMFSKLGGENYIKEIFGDMVCQPDSSDLTFAIRFNIKQPPFPEAELLDKVANMRMHVQVAPIADAMDKFMTSGRFAPFVIPYRVKSHGDIFLYCSADMFSVVHSIRFTESDDAALAHVFLQEVQDAKVMNAPSVIVTRGSIPKELVALKPECDSDTIFVTINMSKRITQKKSSCLPLLFGFRNYVHYHLKCTKGYMHARMRKRSGDWLKVIRRADPTYFEEKTAASSSTPTSSSKPSWVKN